MENLWGIEIGSMCQLQTRLVTMLGYRPISGAINYHNTVFHETPFPFSMTSSNPAE